MVSNINIRFFIKYTFPVKYNITRPTYKTNNNNTMDGYMYTMYACTIVIRYSEHL